MKKQCYIASVLIWNILVSVASADTLSARFRNPSEETKPWCYWFWLKGDITGSVKFRMITE